MFETMDKLFLAGLGALSMTRQKAEELFDDLVSRGEAQKADREGFVKRLTDSAEKARKDLEEMISKQMHQALVKMNIPTREDLARLETKLNTLAKKLDEQGSSHQPHAKAHHEK